MVTTRSKEYGMNQTPTPPSAPAAVDIALVDSVVDVSSVGLAPHDIERAVMQKLQNHPSLRFTRLQVHQCGHDSVCLEGFLESNDAEIDLCELVRGIHGIKDVSNRVLTVHPIRRTAK